MPKDCSVLACNKKLFKDMIPPYAASGFLKIEGSAYYNLSFAL